ncbi:hypothetical protein [Clostridium saccharoperbutylacetonicum]
MGFGLEGLASAVMGAVAEVAEAGIKIATEVADVIAAQADIANILEDGQIDEDEQERLLDDIHKLVVGAYLVGFGSYLAGVGSIKFGSESVSSGKWITDTNKYSDDVIIPEEINDNTNVYSRDDADKYINTSISVFGRGISVGRKTYFANEISDLPKEIRYESGGYTYIYTLQEIPIFDGVFGSEPIYGMIITTKDDKVFNNKKYAYVLSYTDEPQMSIGVVLPPEISVEGIEGEVVANKAINGAGNAIFKITNVEKGIMNESVEHGQFFNKEGDMIGDTIVGNKNSIDVSSYQDIAKDSIFTHNHPTGRQFSLEDIQTATGFDMAEIRAVTPDGKVYRMIRGSEGWKVTDPQSIAMAQTMAQTELRSDPVAMQFFKEGNQDAVWNMMFEKIAKTIGGEYKVTN